MNETKGEMIWTLEQNGRELQYEVRLAGSGGRYDLIVRVPDRPVVCETFETTRALNLRTLALQDAFVAEGWGLPPQQAGRWKS